MGGWEFVGKGEELGTITFLYPKIKVTGCLCVPKDASYNRSRESL